MPQAVPIAFGAGIVVALLLFWRLPPRRAAIAVLLGGWLLLPTARYPDDVGRTEFPFWVMPASIPASPWLTKAPVVGLALLLGVLAFDRRALGRLRPAWPDLPMLAWCLWPIVAGAANGLDLAEVLGLAAYQTLSWGVPYLAGRLYCGDPAGCDALATGIVVAGLAYVPACLLETAVGPRLYADLYGFHPYQEPGAVRYLGYRPIVFLEDGNQLGIWMAVAALVAAWSWRSGRLPRILKLPAGAVAGILIGTALLTQSAGAILLLIAGLGALEGVHRAGRVWPLVIPMALLLALLGARAVNLIDAKALAQRTAPGRLAVAALYRLDRQSFGWRLRVEERQTRRALEHPWTGRGRWDWWRPGEERPWGLPGLVLGMFGLPGWALLLTVLALPIARFLTLASPASWTEPGLATAAALAAALGVVALDAILNGAYPLFLLAGAGALASPLRPARAIPAAPPSRRQDLWFGR